MKCLNHSRKDFTLSPCLLIVIQGLVPLENFLTKKLKLPEMSTKRKPTWKSRKKVLNLKLKNSFQTVSKKSKRS